ncbi:MAG: type IX secretion system membrane protein PorP/SprF [Crocinitomicaceae bacterium]|nr:type IX secretion system membrane protein PorP/SprF [Crocinitomicaceae bacterium]
MKKFLAIILISTAGTVSAQQISLNSQYLFNEMAVNPGATGSKEYIPVQLNFRKQWTSFPGSPTTQSLSCHSKVFGNMGLGGSIFNDVTGPSRRTGMTINTAYHLQLDARKEHILGLGIGLSFTQHLIDVNKLSTYLPDDPAVTRGYNNTMVPDANFGVFYRFKDKAYAGLSAYNLVELRRDLYDFQNPLYNPMTRTYYLFGGYNFELGQNFGLKASTLGQGIETGTVQFDVTALGVYKDMVWLGASYRHTDAVAILVGGQVGQFKFGYAYDYTLSDIGNYSSGSHEVFLELQLYTGNVESKTPWLKRNRIYSLRL